MATTIRAVFDGEVLRPEEPNGLRPATTYIITVEAELEPEAPYALAEIPRIASVQRAEAFAAREPDDPEEVYPLTALGRLAMDMGVEDFAARHDWYAHGRLPDDTP